MQLLIGVGLGPLVGLQRERQGSDVAHNRTFPLITLFGTVNALLAHHWGTWIVPASIIGLSAMVIMGNLSNLRRGETDLGITTELAILVMFCAGAAVMKEHTVIKVVVGGRSLVPTTPPRSMASSILQNWN